MEAIPENQRVCKECGFDGPHYLTARSVEVRYSLDADGRMCEHLDLYEEEIQPGDTVICGGDECEHEWEVRE